MIEILHSPVFIGGFFLALIGLMGWVLSRPRWVEMDITVTNRHVDESNVHNSKLLMLGDDDGTVHMIQLYHVDSDVEVTEMIQQEIDALAQQGLTKGRIWVFCVCGTGMVGVITYQGELTFPELPGEEQRCGRLPPTPGYAGCTRDKGHEGPCAHPFDESIQRAISDPQNKIYAVHLASYEVMPNEELKSLVGTEHGSLILRNYQMVMAKSPERAAALLKETAGKLPPPEDRDYSIDEAAVREQWFTKK